MRELLGASSSVGRLQPVDLFSEQVRGSLSQIEMGLRQWELVVNAQQAFELGIDKAIRLVEEGEPATDCCLRDLEAL